MAKKKGLYQPQSWETIGATKHWTRLFDDMVTSPAFTALSPDAKILYFYLKREYKGLFNEKKDTVIFPYSQAVSLTGIRKGNIRKCISELEEFGFIKTVQIGGLYRLTNHYVFISEWKTIDEKAAKARKQRIRGLSKRKSSNPSSSP